MNTEIRTGEKFDFSVRVLARQVIRETLRREGCPYDVSVDLLVTGPEEVRELNRDFRGIDRDTDVLSFPGLDLAAPSAFDTIAEGDPACFDPDTGLLCMGSIVLQAQKIRSQAAEYGHSEKREFAFLVAHSVLHLCGYDHETEEEAAEMESRQEAVLSAMGIRRC